ncbi:DUF4190 domain-containing protein [Chloroflexota bacterium]
MFCPMCGAPNEDEAVFCGNCGATLNPDEVQVETGLESAEGASPELVEGASPELVEGAVAEATEEPLDDLVGGVEEALETPDIDRSDLDVEDALPDIPPVEQWEAAVPAVPPAPAPPLPPPRVQAPVAPSVSTSGLAIASLVLGICGLTILPLIASILAIILGYMARRDIRQRPDEVTGEGMAMAGIVMGWIAVGLAVAGLLLFGGLTVCGICGAFGSAGSY